jgi:hypothetical protein
MNVLATVTLVIVSTAAALGLGAVTVSLMPPPGGAHDATWTWAPTVGAGGAASATWSRKSGHDRAPLTTMSWDRESEPVRAVLPLGSSPGHWASPLYPESGVALEGGANDHIDMISGSPLYPKIGVTLWHRIRDSSPEDRRAFLLGTAIQVHARAAAATPGPRSALPHGVD